MSSFPKGGQLDTVGQCRGAKTGEICFVVSSQMQQHLHNANALMMRMLSAMVMMFFCDLQRRANMLFENTIREFSALNDDKMVVVLSGSQKMMQSLL